MQMHVCWKTIFTECWLACRSPCFATYARLRSESLNLPIQQVLHQLRQPETAPRAESLVGQYMGLSLLITLIRTPLMSSVANRCVVRLCPQDIPRQSPTQKSMTANKKPKPRP